MEYETVTYNEVQYHDFEDAVRSHFGEKYKDYEYAADEEVSNYTNKSYSIDGNVDEFDLKDIENGRKNYMARTLLDKMCADGLIPSGEYLIECSW